MQNRMQVSVQTLERQSSLVKINYVFRVEQIKTLAKVSRFQLSAVKMFMTLEFSVGRRQWRSVDERGSWFGTIHSSRTGLVWTKDLWPL